jgi:hypothetical protein
LPRAGRAIVATLKLPRAVRAPRRAARIMAPSARPVMENYLKFILSAGSSRTFNCCAISNAILEAAAQPDKPGKPDGKLLFESRALNFTVFIKEPARNKPGMFGPAPNKTLRTRLYFPYNRERPHEGGVSIDSRDPRFDEALQETAGLDKKNRPQAYEHDKRILRILDELPSLDPFLMKDRFRQASMVVPDHYLYILPEEWDAIRAFVHDQFMVVAQVIFPTDTGQVDEKAEQLTQQLWDLRDLAHLSSLTKVFGVAPERTEEIFYSWKGVIYYDYENTRLKPQIETLFKWFDQGSMPKDFCKPIVEKELDRSRAAIKNLFNAARAETDRHLSTYHKAFDLFFKERKTASDFVAFLQTAPKNFYSLGESISKLSHAVVIWDRATQNFQRRMLPSDALLELFGFIQEIF